MITKTEYTVKDCAGTCTYAKLVDKSKPKAWVEGNFYKFNSEIDLVAVNREVRVK